MKLKQFALLGMLVGSVALAGCDEKPAAEKKADTSAEKKQGDGDEAAEKKSEAAEKKAEGKTEPASADEDDAAGVMSAADLLKKFAEDKDAWLDKEVTVKGLYFSSSYVGSGDDKKLNNFSMVVSKDDTKDTVTCEISDDSKVKDLKQYDEVKVKGKVREFFKKPSLSDCALVD